MTARRLALAVALVLTAQAAAAAAGDVVQPRGDGQPSEAKGHPTQAAPAIVRLPAPPSCAAPAAAELATRLDEQRADAKAIRDFLAQLDAKLGQLQRRLDHLEDGVARLSGRTLIQGRPEAATQPTTRPADQEPEPGPRSIATAVGARRAAAVAPVPVEQARAEPDRAQAARRQPPKHPAPAAEPVRLSKDALAALGMPAAPRTYVVRQGDTLFSIARRFGVTPLALARANRLTNDHIEPAQALVIPDE
jgi:nucleoid-associated protein YgaU